MRVVRWGLALVFLVVLAIAAVIGPEIYKAASEDPTVWNSDVDDLVRRASEAPPNPVLFVGSSSIRLWADLAEDMAPLPVLQMGFGGGKMGDLLHHLGPLVLQHPARAIVVFMGTNDLNGFGSNAGKDPDVVVGLYERIVDRIRKERPDTPVYYLAIKPTTRFSNVWPKAAQVNRGIQEHSDTDPMLHFIDANAPVILPDGSANPDLLLWDGIHLNREGYRAWSKPIRERLLRDLESAARAPR